jgi:DNA-binding XRE family transcriptional regulator
LPGGVVAVSEEDYSTERYYTQVLFRDKKNIFDFFYSERYYIFQKGGSMMSLGKEIKKARIDKGWQQKDLQEATGLSQKYLSQVELDKVDPRFSVVKRIARALGVSLDTLAKEDEESTAPQPTRQQTRKATQTT